MLASLRDLTAPMLGVPLLASGLVLALGVTVDRRARAAASVVPATNWAEEFTARVRRERAAARASTGAAAE